MKSVIWTLLLFSFVLPVKGQYIVTGKIADDKGKSLEFVNIVIKKDAAIIATLLSDSAGHFKTTGLPAALYQLTFHRYDCDPQQLSVQLTADTVITIRLPYKAKQLKEVVVAGAKPIIERKIDRLVFNVENAVAASGGDALDALKITPGIQVQNDQISMVGKGRVKVMINDRIIQLSGEELSNFLATIKSDNIQSIEVISNPPARYDAQGNSGLVNIKLKKAAVNSWNAALTGTYTQATYGTGGGAGSFSYQKNKLSFTANIDYKEGNRDRTEKDRINYPDQSWNTDFHKTVFTRATGINAGIDYQLTKRWSMGAQYLGSFSRPGVTEEDEGILTNRHTGKTDSLINTAAASKRVINAASLNWHSDIVLSRTGSKLLLNVDYFGYNNNVDRTFSTQNTWPNGKPIEGSFVSTNNTGQQDIKNYAARADIDMPLKWIKLSYGGKLSRIESHNDLSFYNTTTGVSILDPGKSNVFNYKEQTEALYISGNRKFSRIWEAQAGLRMENTRIEGVSVTYNQVNTNNYLQLFPTFYLAYTPNKVHSFSASYGRRIERPGYASLNPFRFYSSPYNYSEGNPALAPQYANNIEIKHAFKEYLYTTLFFLNETNGFGEVPFVDDKTQMQYFTQLNYFTYNSAGLSEAFSIPGVRWWENDHRVDVFYAASRFTKAVKLDNTTTWGCMFSTANTFLLNSNGTLKGSVNFWYRSPRNDLLYTNKGRASLDLALKYQLLKNNLLLALIAQDVLRTDERTATTYTGNVEQRYYSYFDNRQVRITVTYKLGNKKIAVKNRKFGNEEEKKRAQ
ncbi:TonB-dependent receptor domain-containing protein [Chitinophaga nivalis]|uniref:TonB-dependent receptor n=1 Tax=Chitinophaga nivalis TaxID=2991709 RepID=A0ABT3IL01_9BACT|nr:TonB-dependent receptor [Chitinophaga nivalis]MCW3465678.1 TonB-dependent receptor [Chitinophaga nivalis]MCW3484631.1 TonB-dependent receptor [Chitinophaga nivalis]